MPPCRAWRTRLALPRHSPYLRRMPFPSVHPVLDAALAARGYDEPTAVQSAVLQPGTEGRDLLVSARTGSGKTVAFGLAAAATLMPDGELPAPGLPIALAIAPTRELALQGAGGTGLAVCRRAHHLLRRRHGHTAGSTGHGAGLPHRGGDAGPAGGPSAPRQPGPGRIARRGVGRGGRDAGPGLRRGAAVHPGRRPRRAPHAAVQRHHPARHRQPGPALPEGRAADRHRRPHPGACRHRVPRHRRAVARGAGGAGEHPALVRGAGRAGVLRHAGGHQATAHGAG